ncbi:MAG TPA: hypothetical protein VMK32_08300 [Burkholderiaceae bacterium]|nr:hypothetical protein [Burkholderiaceae bacterium]
MQALSSDDGSADAVRQAADAAWINGENRATLERELDRLNLAVQGSAAALGQHLSWMMLTQGFAIAAYAILLVGGWTLPLPGKRWLLLGIVAIASLSIVLTYLGLRAARDRVGPLKSHRQRVEDALERVAARPPVFARQGLITSLLAHGSTRGLPLLLCAGWVALALYTLSLPLPAESARPVAAAERTGSAPATAAAAKPRPAAAAAQKAGSTVEAPTAAAESGADGESPLLNFLRRAVNTPPAVENQERVGP